MTSPEADARSEALWGAAMDRALALARRGAGHVSPNPLVGAVVLGPGGQPWGEGWHGAWGGPHAEVWAVRDAERRGFGPRLAEATLVVTLEPCSHTGKTPPCAEMVVARGFRRVVVGLADPHPLVAGRGLARLRAGGIETVVGVRAREAFRLAEPFVRHVLTDRPLVTLKWAQTLDGQVATRTGDSRWVSAPESRTLVHRWRAETDAVLVGAGTARADDPALTVRLVPGRQPLRVVLDREGTLPPRLRLFTDAHAGRTLAVHAEGTRPPYAEALRAAGGTLLSLPLRAGRLDLEALFGALGRGEGLPAGVRPVQSVLVEAGPGLATALLQGGLVDRLQAFVAPRVLGQGTPATGPLGLDRMADALGFAEASWETVGPDALFSGYVHPFEEGGRRKEGMPNERG